MHTVHCWTTWDGRGASPVPIIESRETSTTRTGLTVHAELDTGSYPKGIKISDQQMKDLEHQTLRRHDFHGEWNYSLIPERSSAPP